MPREKEKLWGWGTGSVRQGARGRQRCRERPTEGATQTDKQGREEPWDRDTVRQ